MIVFALIITVLMLLVFWLDATRFIIPNWLVGIMLALYPFYYFFCPVPIDIVSSLGIMLVAFAIGLALFAGKIMGGGDVKLLTICCLWAGKTAIIPFVIYTSLLGGAMALALMTLRPATAYLWIRATKRLVPRLLEKGAPIPYGIAIGGAMLIIIYNHQLAGIDFSSFSHF